MALIAVHLGVISEEELDNMSYLFFEDVQEEQGHKLTYDAVVNYAGNSFCEKSWDMISKHHPMWMKSGNEGTMKTLADFFGGADVKIGRPEIKGKRVTRE